MSKSIRFTIALLYAAVSLSAQTAVVPSDYQDLYTTLQGHLDSFYTTVSSGWDGSTPSVDFSGELLTANANRGLQLLSSQTYPGVLVELNALKTRGVKAVTVQIGFPILSPAFFKFNGDPGDDQAILAFYQQLSQDVHAAGLKLIVESGVLFPGVYSSGSGLNLGDYYKSLSSDQYIAGRAQVIAAVAQQIQPDYLSMGSEPDTEAQLTGMPFVNTPDGFASMMNYCLSQAKTSGVLFGAGVGTWLQGAPSFVNSLGATGIDFIDLHIYPVNYSFLTNVISLADSARSLGKEVAISEAWLLKERDSEFSTSDVASNPSIFARDAYSFWQPLDQEFLAGMVRFSYWKNLKFFSAFWTKYFWAYLDYDSTQGLSATDLTNQSNSATATALGRGWYTGTGGFYNDAVKVTGPPVTALSGASFSPFALAPNSIVTLFGANLSSGQEQVSVLPLPSQVNGTSVSITDSAGNQHPASFFFASTDQLNVFIPSSVAVGPAVITVNASNGAQASSAVTISTAVPALFSASANGKGLAAAIVVYVSPSGVQTYSPTVQCSANGCSAIPIQVGSGQTILELFGTGLGGVPLSNITATIGGVQITPQYAAAQGHFVGLDQINIAIPDSLAYQGMTNVQVTVNGVASNTVTIDLE